MSSWRHLCDSLAGGAAIGGPVEDVLPVVLGLPLSNTAAEAFGDLLASLCDLLCTSNGMS